MACRDARIAAGPSCSWAETRDADMAGDRRLAGRLPRVSSRTRLHRSAAMSNTIETTDRPQLPAGPAGPHRQRDAGRGRASPSSATAGRARPASACRATACRAWSKTAGCSSAAAATSAMSRARQLPPSATQHRPELAGAPFEAMGVSLVMHPRNPLRADRAHERAHVRRAARRARAGGVVRRRHGPDALLRLRGGRAAFPPHLPRRAGALRRATCIRASRPGATSTSSSSTATSRAASAASSSTTSPSSASTAASR